MPTRRTVIAAAGLAVAGLAGCNETTGPATEDGRDADTETDATATPRATVAEARVPPAETTPEACEYRPTETVTPTPNESVEPPEYPDPPPEITSAAAVTYATEYERALIVQENLARYDCHDVQSVTVDTTGVRTRTEHGGVLVTFSAAYEARLRGSERLSATVSDGSLIAYHVGERGVWRAEGDPEDGSVNHPLTDGDPVTCGR